MPESPVPARTPGFRLGPHRLEFGLALAPMAGNTNSAYRRLCRRFGAEWTTTEMVSSRALHYNDRKSLGYLEKGDDEVPCSAQVFGAEPEILAAAAQRVAERGFHGVDLNVGCPVPKITGCGGGSALLREPGLAFDCVRAMVEAVDLPVTVKIRAGWDERQRNAPAFAALMEEAGAVAITIHGRTREQRYRGRADLGIVRDTAAAVSIPVLGNGDVVDVASARRMAATGVAGIAVGRGALGRPWFFAQLRAAFAGEPIPPDPPVAERAELLLELGRGVADLHGERRGLRIMRRLAADFFKGLPGAPRLRAACNALETLDDLRRLSERMRAEAASAPFPRSRAAGSRPIPVPAPR